MLSYQEDKKLEKLLESLFGDSELTPDDVEVLWWPIGPGPLTSCCTYSYAAYSD